MLHQSDSKTCKTLLIEDDEIDCQALLRAINRSGSSYINKLAKSISEAEQQLKNNSYDIVISDMNLPDSNGMETINKLLKITRNTPIVVVSGTESEEIALQAVHAGAQDYIQKKYLKDADLIVRTLRHAMERHQLKLSLEATRDRERFMALYDQCTSLPNRVLLMDRLNQCIADAKRHKSKFALLFVDLDRFKEVNDSLGHSAGDQILKEVSIRMKKVVRENDTVARFGGDEFVLILQQTHEKKDIRKIANKIIRSVSRPIIVKNQPCEIGASVGVACFPDNGPSAQMLLKHADMAMYKAKRCGRNQMYFFNSQLLEKVIQSFNKEKSLRAALKNADEYFKLFYQPKVDLQNGNISSVEALIRWQHPDEGWLQPNEFIPYAEDHGLIQKIDEWVMEAACRQAKTWQNNQHKVKICLNLSSRSFSRKNFVKSVVEPLINKYQIDGSSLEVEITERVLLNNSLRVQEQIFALKSLGITLTIDDFGTGFSSLSYLNRFPFDTLKIDGSFICDEASSHKDKALLKAIINLGETLNLTVVAECIQTKKQLEYLKSLHCHQGQGFFWGKPCEDWSPILIPASVSASKLL